MTRGSARFGEELEREETSWANLIRDFVGAHQKNTQEKKEASDIVMNDATPLGAKQIAFNTSLALSNIGWAQINALLTSKLGRELSRTHQRLADVEKELKDLRAARK